MGVKEREGQSMSPSGIANIVSMGAGVRIYGFSSGPVFGENPA